MLYRQHRRSPLRFPHGSLHEQGTLANLLAKFRYRVGATSLGNPKGLFSRIKMVKFQGRTALVVATPASSVRLPRHQDLPDPAPTPGH